MMSSTSALSAFQRRSREPASVRPHGGGVETLGDDGPPSRPDWGWAFQCMLLGAMNEGSGVLPFYTGTPSLPFFSGSSFDDAGLSTSPVYFPASMNGTSATQRAFVQPLRGDLWWAVPNLRVVPTVLVAVAPQSALNTWYGWVDSGTLYIQMRPGLASTQYAYHLSFALSGAGSARINLYHNEGPALSTRHSGVTWRYDTAYPTCTCTPSADTDLAHGPSYLPLAGIVTVTSADGTNWTVGNGASTSVKTYQPWEVDQSVSRTPSVLVSYTLSIRTFGIRVNQGTYGFNNYTLPSTYVAPAGAHSANVYARINSSGVWSLADNTSGYDGYHYISLFDYTMDAAGYLRFFRNNYTTAPIIPGGVNGDVTISGTTLKFINGIVYATA